MNAPELIELVERAGGLLTINGDKLKCRIPEDQADTLLPELRRLRDEVLAVIRQREAMPALPAGVTIIEWNPKQAPIELHRWSVVTDVPAFITGRLQFLEAAMKGNAWLAGNRSVRDILEELEQVGVKLAVEQVTQ